MNDAPRIGAGAEVGLASVRLGDLPFVFLSYDEPWADHTWADLKRKVPGAVRVHGIKGLDACHKAAADAVPGDWVVTIDADTVIDAAAPRIAVPRHLIREQYRLDWLSRNKVNGLWSGNGCIKLWSKRILREMRTHEAAPEGHLSIDHDIGNVIPGQSGQLTLPERASETDPARTARHAFRAGFREAVFLHRMAVEDAERRGLPCWQAAGTARVIGVWCSVGRHVANGPWVLYGARLGLLWHRVQPGWDLRGVNDYDWLSSLWEHRIAPRFGAGEGWRWDWLEEDLRHLAERLAGELDFPVAEFGPDTSRVIAESDLLSPNAAASRCDALGYRLMMSSDDPSVLASAREYLEVARCLDHPSAFDNVGSAHRRGIGPDASRDEAVWNFRAAMALGNANAAPHLAEMADTGPVPDESGRPARLASEYPFHRADSIPEGAEGFCFVAEPGVDPGPAMARHVPDPALCAAAAVISYAARCALTSRIVPDAVRFGPVGAFAADPEVKATVMLPVVLGLRAVPHSAGAAEAMARADVSLGAVEAGFAGLGRDGRFGEVYADTVLALSGGPTEPDWSSAQCCWVARLLPEVATPEDWTRAADSLDALGQQGRAATLRRTAAAVWGRKPPWPSEDRGGQGGT